MNIGLVGGPRGRVIRGNFANADGTIRVLKEKCHNCPYRPNNEFSPQLKRIHKATQDKEDDFNYCHNTYPDDVPDAMCRGSFDAFKSRFRGEPCFVEESTSLYAVYAVND